MERLPAAQRCKALLIKRAQHLGLGFQAHVTHLVQQERAAVGALKDAALFRCCARDGAIAVTKQFALDKVLGDRRALQLQKHALRPQAFRVHGARDQLLARAGLAKDQHTPVGRRHQANLLPQRLGRHTVAGDRRAGQLLLHLAVVRAQLPPVHRVADRDQRPLQRKRFFKKIKRAQLGRAHRGFNGAVARDHNDLWPPFAGQGADLGQRFQPVTVRQPDIEQQHIVVRIAQQQQRFGRARGRGHKVAFLAQNLRQRIANVRLVVRDQDVGHTGTPSAAATTAGSGTRASGSSIRKQAPVAPRCSARIVPWWSCTILAAIARPRPVPRCLVEK